MVKWGLVVMAQEKIGPMDQIPIINLLWFAHVCLLVLAQTKKANHAIFHTHTLEKKQRQPYTTNTFRFPSTLQSFQDQSRCLKNSVVSTRYNHRLTKKRFLTCERLYAIFKTFSVNCASHAHFQMYRISFIITGKSLGQCRPR